VAHLTGVATATGLARPTARRLLLTLEELGFIRYTRGQFTLAPRVLRLAWPLYRRSACGTLHAPTSNDWSPPPENPRRCRSSTLGHRLRRPSRRPQIDRRAGADRHPYPAAYTALGKVLLSALDPAHLQNVLAERAGRVCRRIRPATPKASPLSCGRSEPAAVSCRRGARSRRPLRGRSVRTAPATSALP